ncbi:FAD:protein FMN transferase [Spirosoma daeguense]
MTPSLHIFQRVQRLMGNRFELSVVGSDEGQANTWLDKAVAEISRIEQLLTTYRDDSQTAQINACAGVCAVKVDPELFALIERSLRLSALTQGAFDITYGSIDKRFWNFDTSMTALPSPKTAQQLVRLINYRNVVLNSAEGTVFLKEKGMRIGFGGIGKGYAAERARQVLRQEGVESGIVNAAGDLTTWGQQPNGQDWTIGIADPNGMARQAFSWLAISNMAVATSGNYEKYVLINGKRYAHTIDPKTGYPVSGIKSVTIIAPNAELADALATPVMVMGVRVGLDMINQMKHIACIIIDDNDTLYTSNTIRLVAPTAT